MLPRLQHPALHYGLLLLQDEDRTQQGFNSVPDAAEMNTMLARGSDEFALFERMDAEMAWPQPASGKALLSQL